MLFLPQAAGVRDPAHALKTSLKSGAAKALDLPEKAHSGAAAAALDACELPSPKFAVAELIGAKLKRPPIAMHCHGGLHCQGSALSRRTIVEPCEQIEGLSGGCRAYSRLLGISV